MKRKWAVFLLCLACLVISLMLLWNLGVFCDEHNTTPAQVCGGTAMLTLYWLRLLFLSAATVFSGVGLVKTGSKKSC